MSTYILGTPGVLAADVTVLCDVIDGSLVYFSPPFFTPSVTVATVEAAKAKGTSVAQILSPV